MRDFNNDKLNESIRNKFADTEVQPGNAVWEGIEAGLLKQENKKMQKRAFFYRNVAAAVIFIALISIYFNLQDYNFETNSIQSFSPIELDSQEDQIFDDNDVVLTKPHPTSTQKSIVSSIKKRNKIRSVEDDQNSKIAAATANKSQSRNRDAIQTRSSKPAELASIIKKENAPQNVEEKDATTDSFAKTNQKGKIENENRTKGSFVDSEVSAFSENQLQAENKQQNVAHDAKNGNQKVGLDKLDSRAPEAMQLPIVDVAVESVTYFAVSAWEKPKKQKGLAWNTDVNIGSGSFNPNSEITETPLFSTVSSLNNPGTSGRTVDGQTSSTNSKQERKAVEDLSSAPMHSSISVTVGLNVGVRLNDRWNIKSGLQYGAYRSSSSSSTVLRDRNSDQLYPYHGASSSTEIADGKVVNVTSEYELYNDFQILTVPLMVSYKVIDRKFDVAIVGGLSADFIIRNTLKGGSDQIHNMEFDQRDRQSYQKVFGSGLAGIEISYPIADQYALSIMPSYKKALSNVTTSSATFDSMPAFLGLNMSLSYMF